MSDKYLDDVLTFKDLLGLEKLNIGVLQVPQLVKMNNFSGQYLQGGYFQTPIYSLYPFPQTIETEARLFLQPQ